MCICSSYFINFCLAAHTLIKGYLKIWGVLDDRLLALKNYLKVEQQMIYISKYILAINIDTTENNFSSNFRYSIITPNSSELF